MELLFYRNFEHEDLLSRMQELFAGGGGEPEKRKSSYLLCVSQMLEMAAQYGLEGNLWHACVTFCLVCAENPFSTACEMRGVADDAQYRLALTDFAALRKLYLSSLSKLDEEFGLSLSPVLENYYTEEPAGHVQFNKRVRDRIQRLSAELEKAGSAEEFASLVAAFYREYGVGRFGLHKAFRVSEGEGGKAVITPITRTEHVDLEQIIGYERQKARLVENTEAFLARRPANNVLLYGDAGTGKSSSVKAVMNRYYGQGLRLVEMYKHQMRLLPGVIDQLKKRNYRFIIYMDDLSFEEFEVEYKYLKAVIEGGLETKPDNVLIYATSNRRHLIKETTADSKDYDTELHSSDTVQEKTSLAARFGVSIHYGFPDRKDYEKIVLALAKREGLTMEEDRLLTLANQWELTHGGRSGRCARQLVNYLAAQEKR